MRRLMSIIICCLAALAQAAAARDLAVPTDKGWRHASTGLVLRAALDGLPRSGLTDSTSGELDVAAQFETPDHATVATIFIFRPADGDIGVWFDRAHTQILFRDIYGGAQPLTSVPQTLLVPGASGAGLRQAYTPNRRFRGTALAAIPLGAWLVTVRVTAQEEDARAVDARLSRVVAAIGWPSQAMPTGRADVPADCPTPLTFGKAKLAKPEGAEILGSLAALAATEAKPSDEADEPFCREPGATAAYGAYRRGDAESYMLALGDAGRTVTVEQSTLARLISGKKRWSVALYDLDGTVSAYRPYDRLPAPDLVLKQLTDGAPVSQTRGSTTTIDSRVVE